MLYETSSRSAQAWSVLNGITHSYTCHTCHTFYTCKGRATPGNLHLQSATAVTHCWLIATHFTDPRKDDSLCQARECLSHLYMNIFYTYNPLICCVCISLSTHSTHNAFDMFMYLYMNIFYLLSLWNVSANLLERFFSSQWRLETFSQSEQSCTEHQVTKRK